MNYFFKNFNLTFFDLVFVAIVGGLLVNLFTFIISKIFGAINKNYIRKVKEHFKEKWKEIQYWKRVKNKSITNIDLLKIGRRKRDGTVTEEERLAEEHKEKQSWDSMTDEQREEIEKRMDRIKQGLKQWKP